LSGGKSAIGGKGEDVAAVLDSELQPSNPQQVSETSGGGPRSFIRARRPSDQVIAGRYLLREWVWTRGSVRNFVAEDQRTGAATSLYLVSGESNDGIEVAASLLPRCAALAGTSRSCLQPLTDYGSTGADFHVAEELPGGCPLGTWLEEQAPLSLGQSLLLVRQLTRVLGALHRLGMGHGGLRPAGVLVTMADHGPQLCLPGMAVAPWLGPGPRRCPVDEGQAREWRHSTDLLALPGAVTAPLGLAEARAADLTFVGVFARLLLQRGRGSACADLPGIERIHGAAVADFVRSLDPGLVAHAGADALPQRMRTLRGLIEQLEEPWDGSERRRARRASSDECDLSLLPSVPPPAPSAAVTAGHARARMTTWGVLALTLGVVATVWQLF